MSWLSFITEIVSSLAWPLTGLAIVFVFRKELAKIIQRIAHLKYKDLELDFDKIREPAEELHREASGVRRREKNPVLASWEEQVLDSMERAPSAAILLAWSGLEASLASAVARMGISPDPPSYRSPRHNIDMLAEYAGLPKKYAELSEEMRTLRNTVAHQRESLQAITQAQARDYANAAIDMVGYLERIKRDR